MTSPIPDLVTQLEHSLFGSAPNNDLWPTLTQAGQLKSAGEVNHFIDGSLGICRRLYEGGRSFEAIPIARMCRYLTDTRAELSMKLRTATAYGIVLAENGNYAGAIEQYSQALKLAENSSNNGGMARTWVNIGTAFFYAANYPLAIEAYLQAVSYRRHLPLDTFPLYAAYVSMAQCYFHVSKIEYGLRAAKKALALETDDILKQDPVNPIFLRRNYVRLLIAANKINEAKHFADETIRLSETSQSGRAVIAAMVTRGLYEIGCGETDIGLTRVQQALEAARSLPAALRDTLACLVQAENLAGRPDRACYYLNELADTVYRDSVEQARKHIKVSRLFDDSVSDTLEIIDTSRQKLNSEDRVYRSVTEWQMFETLAINANFKFDSSGLHGIRVGNLTELLAVEYGYPLQMAAEIGYAARFHDIGMNALPDTLLEKRTPLTSSERCLLEKHCHAGAELFSSSDYSRAIMVMDIAKYHHEWWNGQGYPNRIAGEAIPRPARLCAVADVFDALVSERSYRARISIDDAANMLQTMAGNQLDPQLVACFLKSLQQGTIRQHLTGHKQHSSLPGLDDLVASLSHGLN